MFEQMKKAREEEGFTLIELLITIVVVGILAAVVVLSISGLTDTGAKSACKTTRDAATTATQVYYANHNAWPTSFDDMKGHELADPGTDVTMSGTTVSHGSDWTLTMHAGTPPTYTCVPA
jgi:prepilin-type N-terminal cleavage/methylation domain-containing protein